MKQQLILPGLPRPRGGERIGAGRKKKAIQTTTIRVADGIAEACKRLDARYRETISAPETEQAVLIALEDRAMVIRTTEETRLIAERLVDEALAGPLAELSAKEKKAFVVLLLERLFEMYPEDVVYPHAAS